MRYLVVLILFVTLLGASGCTPTREITYSVKGIEPVSVMDSVTMLTHSVSLTIEPFEDARRTVPENGELFVRGRETTLDGKDYCINAEEHYKENTVPTQIATIMASHMKKRGTFKTVSSKLTDPSEYSLTGKLKRLYGVQEVSTTAKVGSMFGLLGALATSGAKTNGNILIEFTDLTVHRKSDGATTTLEDVSDSLSGEMHADGECWCIYDNVNDQLKESVDKLAVMVEDAVAGLEAGKKQK